MKLQAHRFLEPQENNEDQASWRNQEQSSMVDKS